MGTAMRPWKAGGTASKPKPPMADALRPVPGPSTQCPNISKCITIANGYIQGWAILARRLLKPKKPLSGVSVKVGQDQFDSLAKALNKEMSKYVKPDNYKKLIEYISAQYRIGDREVKNGGFNSEVQSPVIGNEEG
mgnify:CR=1 FL=1